MVVLLDTNVVLNYVSGRQDRYLESSRVIMNLCGNGRISGCIAFHSISIIWYALKIPADEKRMWLRDICHILTVVSASHEQVTEAVNREDFRDFEDCLQDECAQSAKADYLITCNKKDYKTAKTRVLTPDEFLEAVWSDR